MNVHLHKHFLIQLFIKSHSHTACANLLEFPAESYWKSIEKSIKKNIQIVNRCLWYPLMCLYTYITLILPALQSRNVFLYIDHCHSSCNSKIICVSIHRSLSPRVTHTKLKCVSKHRSLSPHQTLICIVSCIYHCQYATKAQCVFIHKPLSSSMQLKDTMCSLHRSLSFLIQYKAIVFLFIEHRHSSCNAKLRPLIFRSLLTNW